MSNPNYPRPSLVRLMVLGPPKGFFMPVGGMLERRIGVKRTVFLGGSVAAAGTALAALAVEHSSVAGLVLTGGALFGTGVGLGYVAPLVCGYQWLPTHKGVVSGVVVAGFGGGAVIFDQIATAFVNPNDVDVTSEDDECVERRLLCLYSPLL